VVRAYVETRNQYDMEALRRSAEKFVMG
jgi:hypothetical protein